MVCGPRPRSNMAAVSARCRSPLRLRAPALLLRYSLHHQTTRPALHQATSTPPEQLCTRHILTTRPDLHQMPPKATKCHQMPVWCEGAGQCPQPPVPDSTRRLSGARRPAWQCPGSAQTVLSTYTQCSVCTVLSLYCAQSVLCCPLPGPRPLEDNDRWRLRCMSRGSSGCRTA